jgi:photosystem II stability/assembly factor-like uncharacterized protein
MNFLPVRAAKIGDMIIHARRCAVFVLAAFAAVGAAAPGQTTGQTSGPWVLEKSGTTAGLRGIHAVGGGVAWASGTNGTVLRTEDGGYEWQSCAMPPGAEKLDFRGVWAWDDQTAIVMSSGPGDASRLYKTADGCSSWKLLFTNPDKDGFWDAMVFLSRNRGYLLGDPVRGKFAFFTTKDGGASWSRSESAGLASGPEASGAFAASNTSLLGERDEPVAFGTGGAVFYSQQFTGSISFPAKPGTPVQMTEQWNRVGVPLARTGEAAGIFSLGFHEGEVQGYGFTLVAVGGDYTKPDESAGTAAWSTDGGKTWTASAKPPHGYRSAVAWDADAKAWIAAGTNGSDISYDDGKTWAPLDDGNWNALSLPWVAGPNGRIAKLGALPGH